MKPLFEETHTVEPADAVEATAAQTEASSAATDASSLNPDAKSTPKNMVVELRSSISYDERELGGKLVAVLFDDETGRFFHVGSEEVLFCKMLDGTFTIEEIVQSMAMSGVPWSEEEIETFVSMLMKHNVVSVVSVNGEPVAPKNVRDEVQARSWLQRVTAAVGMVLCQRIPLGNADFFATQLLPWFRSLLSWPGFLTWLLGVVVASWIAWGLRSEIVLQCKQLFSPSSWPLLACVGIVVKIVHELGHAVTAKRLRVRVGNAGVTLFLFAPLAFIDLTNSWKLVPRWSRMQIAFGGVYFESWLAIFATFLFAWLEDGMARHLAAQVMLVAGPATWITNANPLLRLDGYFVLSDATGIPNLRMHGRKIWASWTDRWFLEKTTSSSHLSGWRKAFAAFHTAASLIFQFVWMSGLVVAVYYWTNAIGVIMASVAAIAWGLLPLVSWWIQNWNNAPPDSTQCKKTRRRMLRLASMAMFLVSAVLSARNPFAHKVPVLVQYRGEQIGRASTDGFVTAVWIASNDIVRRGDVLMEISDEQLVLRRQQMSDDLLVNQAKYQQLQSTGQLAEAAAANETVKQLRVSLAELDQSIAAMQIVAARDGVVVSEAPEKWLGRHAKRGDVLVRVADPDDKEMLVAIQERDFSMYNEAVKRGRPLLSRIRGGDRLMVEPTPAQPRFSQALPHPSLAATSGGDLPVIPDSKSEEGTKAAVPVGTAIAKIPPTQSLGLYAGQRGTIYLEDDQTVFNRLKQWFTKGYEN